MGQPCGRGSAASCPDRTFVRLTASDAQWTQTGWSGGSSFFDLQADPLRVFARTWDSVDGGRMSLTADDGASWTQIGPADGASDILSIAPVRDGLLAGTWDGFYRSTSGGASWTPVTPAGVPAGAAIRSMATIGATLFATTTGHVYESSDDGNTWTEVSAGIPSTAVVTSIAATASAVFAGTASDGVLATTNGGASWAAVNSGLADTRIAQLEVAGTRLFAVTSSSLFVSDDGGATWRTGGSGLGKINCVLAVGSQVLAGTEDGGASLSVDGGASWTSFSSGMPGGARVWSLAATSTAILAGTDSGVWRTPLAQETNPPPTVVAAAAAGPNPVTGTTTSLSALGADDGGEANLTYTWATLGTPPAAVRFSASGTHAARDTTATFAKAGSYALQVTVTDPQGATASSSVTVTVNQTPSSVVVSPASATVPPAGSAQFTATARDQFGADLAMQPTFAWSMSGGGTISAGGSFTAGSTAGGPYTVSATSGGIIGTAGVTVSSVPTAVYQISCGGGAAAPFVADQYGSGGTARTVTNGITIAGITDPAPMAVYQSERYGNSTYTLPNLTPGGRYLVRLHFAELYQTAAGKRVFNVVINGATVLSNFDVYAAAGARYKAVLREFTVTANSSGQIVISFNTLTDNATVEGIEIVPLSANAPPTIASPASASLNPASGTTTVLSVLGADDGGEANLTYTWATTGAPPAAVTFSANGTNAARTTTASFTKAGTYTFQAVVADQGGSTVTSSLAVTVTSSATSIVVAPGSATVSTSATQQFTATALDQFNASLPAQPTFTWGVSGGGTISSSGLFTAGSSAGGPYSVTAQASGLGGSASVTVSQAQATAYRIDCGGAAASPYTADQYYSGGTARTVTNGIDTSGVTSPAPQAVYQSERYGTSTYTLPNLTAGASYRVRLHFAELYWTSAGKRVFHVAINGTTVLSNFDVYAATGASYRAIVKEFTATANASGQLVVTFTTVTDNATIAGIEIVRQ